MSTQDLHHDILTKSALDYIEITSNTTTNGNIIDTQGYESLDFVLHAGAIVDGVYDAELWYGDDSGLSDAAKVSDDFLLGSLEDTEFTDADDNKTRRIGYVAHKRYVQIRVNSTGVTSGGFFGAIAILGHPHRAATPEEIDI